MQVGPDLSADGRQFKNTVKREESEREEMVGKRDREREREERGRREGVRAETDQFLKMVVDEH